MFLLFVLAILDIIYGYAHAFEVFVYGLEDLYLIMFVLFSNNRQ